MASNKKPKKRNFVQTLANRAIGGSGLTPEDRELVQDIKDEVKEIRTVLTSLSSSIIGRVNGDEIDPSGGRLGRVERLVYWCLATSATAMLTTLGFLIKKALF